MAIKKKILYYSPHPLLNLSSPAGYATHMREMITAFRAEGHDVRTLIMGGEDASMVAASGSQAGEPAIKKLVKPFVPARLWESTKDYQLKRFDLQAEQTLKQMASEWKPDLIYERCNYLQLSGVKVAGELGIKHVLEVNAPYVDERITLAGKTWWTGQANRIEKQQLEGTNLAVVVSTALRDYFIKKHGLAADKFLVLPNAVNETLAIPDSVPASIQEELQKRNIKTVFGFVGSVFPWHGIDLLTEAFAQLAEQYSDAGLVIVGDGETLPAIQEKVSAWPCAERIWFVGRKSHQEVFSYIAAMDCTLMVKSNWYGSPVKIFEYGWMNKPIIAPDTIPVRDVMENEVDGLLIPPRPDAVRTAMEYYLKHPAKMQEMAAHFHAKIKAHHLWVHNAQQVINSCN